MMDSAGEKPADTFVETPRRDEIIEEASSKQSPAMLTRFASGGWTTRRTQFLSCDREQGHIWLVQPWSEDDAPLPALRPGEPIGVSFRHRRAKCSFSSVVIGAVVSHEQDRPHADRAVIQWPHSLQEMQRRVYRRVHPPPGLGVDLWLGAQAPVQGTNDVGVPRPEPPTGRPDDARVRTGRLTDLSAGGLRVDTSAAGDDLTRGARFICEFSPRAGDEPLRFEARLQHIESAGGGRRALGFQFVGLDTSTEGQCRLAQLASIVTTFRRSRAGSATVSAARRRSNGRQPADG